MRKKIIAAFSAALLLSLGSCAGTPEKTDGLKVITTNFPPYDFIRQISGGDVTPEILLAGGQDSHSYEPTAKDIIRISEADIFVCTGGESDAWVDTITDSISSDVIIVKMMDFVEPLTINHEHDDDDDDDHGHNHSAEYDEHVWTSPKNAEKIAGGLADALISADGGNAEKYRNGLAAYTGELEALNADFAAATAELKSPLIFGDRFPFTYLAHDYGIEYYAAFSGCSSDTEPSAAKMTALIEKAKETNAKVIYHIEFSTEKVADTIAEAVGAETRLMHSCHSLSDEDMKNGETYISIMRKNIEAMK